MCGGVCVYFVLNSWKKELLHFLFSSLAFSQSHCSAAKACRKRKQVRGRVIAPGYVPQEPSLLVNFRCGALVCDRNTEQQVYSQKVRVGCNLSVQPSNPLCGWRWGKPRHLWNFLGSLPRGLRLNPSVLSPSALLFVPSLPRPLEFQVNPNFSTHVCCSSNIAVCLLCYRCPFGVFETDSSWQ